MKNVFTFKKHSCLVCCFYLNSNAEFLTYSAKTIQDKV